MIWKLRPEEWNKPTLQKHRGRESHALGTATTKDFRQECAWTARKKIFLEYNDTGGMAGFKVWEPGRDQIIEGFVDLNNGLGEERNDSHDDIDDSDLDDDGVDDDGNSTKKKQNQCIHLICASILLIFDIRCSHLSFLKKKMVKWKLSPFYTRETKAQKC